MTLAAYRKAQGLSLRAFAAQVGVSFVTVRLIERGEMRPGLDLALRIAAATRGKVPAHCPRCGQHLTPKHASAHRRRENGA